SAPELAHFIDDGSALAVVPLGTASISCANAVGGDIASPGYGDFTLTACPRTGALTWPAYDSRNAAPPPLPCAQYDHRNGPICKQLFPDLQPVVTILIVPHVTIFP